MSSSAENLTEKNHHDLSNKSSSDEDLPYSPEEVDYKDETDDFYEEEWDHAVEKRKRFYQRKRFWVKCILILIVVLAILIPLIIFVILPKLVQVIVNGSSMSMTQLNMTDVTETDMKVSVAGAIGNAGIFPATIDFPEPIVVSWQDHQLGKMTMASVSAKGGKASILDSTTFSIINSDAFATFSKEMMTIESFTWTLTSTVQVRALGRTIKNINLKKNINMLGMNNFNKVVIDSFEMPGDAPNNTGAYVRLVTSMNNPSPIGVTLGTMVLDLSYNGTYLGQVTATNAVLIGNSASPLTLEGVLIRQTNQTDLDKISNLMSVYLSGGSALTSAKGVSVKPDGVNSISWLSNGLLSLTLNVPLKSPVVLNVINNIQILDMGMVFNKSNPYVPTASSKTVTAGFKLPFNITVGMQSVANTMSLVYNSTVLADINTAVWNQNASDVPNGLLVFNLPSSPLTIKDNAHDQFDQFVAALTVNAEQAFTVQGLASAVSVTPVGTLALSNIPFTSAVTMKGLNFNAIDAVVSNVVVTSGTPEYIIMNQTVALPNPSNLSVTGDSVSLTVFDKATDQYLGDLLIPSLNIAPGANPTATQFLFHPTNATLRDSFLSGYVIGTNFPLKVVGQNNSTAIVEMQTAMSKVELSSLAPGLSPAPLLVTAGTANSNLDTLLGNRQTIVVVTSVNPLATELYVTGQVTQVSWKGNFFGTVNAQYTQSIPANSSADTPSLVLQHPSGLQFGIFLSTQFMPANPAIALGGAMVPFDLDILLSVRVGGANGYPATIHYVQQQNILTKMSIL
ncbi:hypothetical protein BGZ49_000267 [Haplosporangium sp. Z 27]|nr:hypothetical protein BGZ49_000267 [Haplosporangium sp. Z 27]